MIVPLNQGETGRLFLFFLGSVRIIEIIQKYLFAKCLSSLVQSRNYYPTNFPLTTESFLKILKMLTILQEPQKHKPFVLNK